MNDIQCTSNYIDSYVYSDQYLTHLKLLFLVTAVMYMESQLAAARNKTHENKYTEKGVQLQFYSKTETYLYVNTKQKHIK